jgi:hypothetical protein
MDLSFSYYRVVNKLIIITNSFCHIIGALSTCYTLMSIILEHTGCQELNFRVVPTRKYSGKQNEPLLFTLDY